VEEDGEFGRGCLARPAALKPGVDHCLKPHKLEVKLEVKLEMDG
jgi:hypothetical protein